MIQVAERARQGRLRAKFMREIQRDEERQRRAKDRDLGTDAIDQAVVKIQKARSSVNYFYVIYTTATHWGLS